MANSKILTIINQKLVDEKGVTHIPPNDWSFLPAGDAGITRKVTSKQLYWKVVFKKGRRVMSKGIWAPTHIIEQAKTEVEQKRNTPEYQKQLIYNKTRRDNLQKEYKEDFQGEVRKFLQFHQRYAAIEKSLAAIITEFAIPVGSGTVARTKQIPIEDRAAKATIAWMRHNTSNYDNMNIPLIKGKRREVRQKIAKQSLSILKNYREGLTPTPSCPLIKRLNILNTKKIDLNQ